MTWLFGIVSHMHMGIQNRCELIVMPAHQYCACESSVLGLENNMHKDVI